MDLVDRHRGRSEGQRRLEPPQQCRCCMRIVSMRYGPRGALSSRLDTLGGRGEEGGRVADTGGVGADIESATFTRIVCLHS